MIEVLLRSNISNLGSIGDIVQVRPGYARNYLLPQGLAVRVSEENQKMVEKVRRKHLAEEQRRIEDARELANRLEKLSLEIAVKTNEEGRMYGSVTAVMIGEALKSRGFDVPPGSIRLKHHIEEVGIHEVPVHLHAQVESTLQVTVSPQ